MDKQQLQSGFAMLYTIIIISIMLALALGIADVTYKETILSDLARDSEIAFYQADSGVECGMYYSVNKGLFPSGTSALAPIPPTTPDENGVPSTLSCGNVVLGIDYTQNPGYATDYFVYTTQSINGQPPVSNEPCYSITFDKTQTTTPGKDVVSSRGYSTCSSTPQQVERGLSVTY